jgi:hypothetical protein
MRFTEHSRPRALERKYECALQAPYNILHERWFEVLIMAALTIAVHSAVLVSEWPLPPNGGGTRKNTIRRPTSVETMDWTDPRVVSLEYAVRRDTYMAHIPAPSPATPATQIQHGPA